MSTCVSHPSAHSALQAPEPPGKNSATRCPREESTVEEVELVSVLVVEEGPLRAADGVMWVIVRGAPTTPGVDRTAGVSPLPWGQGHDMRTGI